METIKIELSKGKTLMSIVACILGFSLATFVVMKPEVFADIHQDSIPLTMLIGLGVMLITAGFFLFALKKFFSNSDNDKWIINEEGLNMEPKMNTVIRWEDMISIEQQMVNIPDAKPLAAVIIMLKNPQEYIDKETRFIQKSALKYNYSLMQTPYVIGIGNMKISLEDFNKILNQKFEEYKQFQTKKESINS